MRFAAFFFACLRGMGMGAYRSSFHIATFAVETSSSRMERHVERRFFVVGAELAHVDRFEIVAGDRLARFSMASQIAHATSLDKSACTSMGQPLKSTVATSPVIPLKRDFGTTEV